MVQISVSKSRHRYDSDSKPVISGGGFADTPALLIRDQLYKPAPALPLQWNAPNKTDLAEVILRDTAFGAWTLASGIARDSGINKFTKSGGAAAGFSGALGNALNADCSIEGAPADKGATCAVMLQSGGTSGYNFQNGEIEHALVFGANGDGTIWESGVPKERDNFTWAVGDKALVEVSNGIVRYYKISPESAMTLLRSTRSKLSLPVKPTLMIYHPAGILQKVAVWFGPQAKTTIQIYGVLKDFQDWQNKAAWESLAEKTTNKDKSEDFTYFTRRKNLKSLSLNIGWDEGDKYREIVEFYKWHDTAREFIYIDEARQNEFFARFTSAFSDAPLGADTFGMAADIREMADAPSLVRL